MGEVGGNADADESPVHTAIVSSFSLDTFEVTVGRFRAFVAAYPESKPPPGAGAHPLIPGTGWDMTWPLAADAATLKTNLNCDGGTGTWTDDPGANEDKPIGCIDWYELFAFCAWEGRRIPTEAEWELAARGGNEEREYPWGATKPDSSLAAFNLSSASVVGGSPAGNGKWGQSDLAGNQLEWVFDVWTYYTAATCDNCAPSTINFGLANAIRVTRGGAYTVKTPTELASAGRGYSSAYARGAYYGGRCAKSP